MALSRAIEGARHTGQRITWAQEDGTAQDLTEATITATRIDTAGTKTAMTGTFALVTPGSGIFTWAYSAADVATVGRYMVQFKATYADTTFDLTFPEPWIVESAL